MPSTPAFLTPFPCPCPSTVSKRRARHATTSKATSPQAGSVSVSKRAHKPSNKNDSCTSPHVETMVHSVQNKFSTASELSRFLRNAQDSEHRRQSLDHQSSGSGGRTRRPAVVDCYVMPQGNDVVVQPGF